MSTESTGDQIVEEALKWVGYPSMKYNGSEFGQDPERGFDCSGFVKFVLQRCGIFVPEEIRHTREFLDKDFGMLVDWEKRQPGDLVILPRFRGLYAGHIGIILNKRFFIHAQGKDHGRVLISQLLQSRIRHPHPEALYVSSPVAIKRVQDLEDHWQKILNYWEGVE